MVGTQASVAAVAAAAAFGCCLLHRSRGVTSGVVESMWMCPATAKPMEKRESLDCLAGLGIRGDRYCLQEEKGRYSGNPEPGRQLTMITAEAMEELHGQGFSALGGQSCRRNIVTRGLALEGLPGKELRVGEVRVFVHRHTIPCMYLEGLLRQKGLMEAFWDRSGICCEILSGGVIRSGDAVEVLEAPAAPERIRTGFTSAMLTHPLRRSAAQRRDLRELRAGMAEERWRRDPPSARSSDEARKRLQLFDQAFGVKDSSWDGGRPMW